MIITCTGLGKVTVMTGHSVCAEIILLRYPFVDVAETLLQPFQSYQHLLQSTCLTVALQCRAFLCGYLLHFTY